MFFDSWNALLRTLVVGLLAYLALIVLLRISGKRTLSKWNAFDFVVTIALGSILATVILSKSTTLAQGVLGLLLLVLLQFVITWLSVRSAPVREWVTGKPTLLLYRGQLRNEALQSERVAEGEVRGALRAKGFAAYDDVDAVVLETDGSFSVIEKIGDAEPTALSDVSGFPGASGG